MRKNRFILIVLFVILCIVIIIKPLSEWQKGQGLYDNIGKSEIPWTVYAKSVDYNNIYLYETGEGENLTLIFGAFHGDELISALLVYRFAQFIYENEEEINCRLVFVPVLNPDGLISGTRTNKNGVDINRNFPTENWSKEYYSGRYYPGKMPGSELETKAVVSIIEKYKPDRIISVHAPLLMNNYDGPAKELAEEMAKFNGYPVEASIGYPTPGSFGTYTGVERNIPVVTLELPEKAIRIIWKQNKEALLSTLKYKND